jgi:hypothetical protein
MEYITRDVDSNIRWKFRRIVSHETRGITLHPGTNMDLRCPGHMNQPFVWDKRNGNTLWADAATLELTQIDDYDTFIDKGHHSKVKAPAGYKKIRVHQIFNVKHDGRHKVRLVADGQLADIPSSHYTQE